jgi:hypothetical protein
MLRGVIVKATALLLFFLFVASPLWAAQLGGQELNRMMQHSEGHHGDSGDSLASAYEGYVMGVSDGLMGTSLYYYCPPVKVGKKQLLGVVSNYLKSHPGDLHVPAGALVTAALIEAYPCRKKEKE